MRARNALSCLSAISDAQNQTGGGGAIAPVCPYLDCSPPWRRRKALRFTQVVAGYTVASIKAFSVACGNRTLAVARASN
jgi:hypothetical protein